MAKLRVLILGGCGFIGRNLVAYLISNDLVEAIRVADKVPPQVAWLNEEHSRYFETSLVEFKSANLINSESCKNAFSLSDGSNWDLVINCAAETRLGQTDPVYKEGILKLSLNCAKQAALQNVGRYIELSSGNMYSCEKLAHKESDEIEPWGFMGIWKAEVEKEIAEIPNLKYTILRLPIVYGIGDKINLMPRILGAAIYGELKKTMTLLWNEKLRVNTVHVEDVCQAIIFLSKMDNSLGEIYNVVDDAKTTQGSISNLLADIFKIHVDYYGTIISACVDIDEAVEEINDRHLIPWAEACRRDNIENTPLSPHMDSILLQSKNLHLNGEKLKNLGFQLKVPKPTIDKIKEIINDYVKMKVFPPSLAV
ncbi:uncharacterized protein LOC143195575 [Rhynchophorus ferrugineus]|uniref:NAD-dependent epimerase/dehydratase domain-containing protein n=1 Tax=Rhynchophorus ferrugineus TaxID=354439 RepID=A0A834I9P8_RHYFE|nr:hypothetical protein GWI33_012649 [Rhynchophorus ferrugineus]